MKEFIGNLVADAQVAEAIHGEFQRRVRQIRAESALKEAVSAAGGRNLKAIRALVDESAIAGAEDFEAAAKAAVAAWARLCRSSISICRRRGWAS